LIGGDGNGNWHHRGPRARSAPWLSKGTSSVTNGLGSGGIFADSGSIEIVTIGRSLIGGNGPSASGTISAAATLGPVKIGGDIRGGSGGGGGFFSGYVTANEITSLDVKGSILGGAGAAAVSSCGVQAGKTTIGKDIAGGSGAHSAGWLQAATCSSTVVGGSVIGGAGNGTG